MIADGAGELGRFYEDVREGEPVEPVEFPLSVYRLVMAAGANRDFNSIHHNSEYARLTGAREMYANTIFLLGMWERTVRSFIGNAGTIRSIAGFRMRSFNFAGETTRVSGQVIAKRIEDGAGLVEFQLQSHSASTLTVGPGTVLATMPLRRT